MKKLNAVEKQNIMPALVTAERTLWSVINTIHDSTGYDVEIDEEFILKFLDVVENINTFNAKHTGEMVKAWIVN
jgi:hypothetical protein